MSALVLRVHILVSYGFFMIVCVFTLSLLTAEDSQHA